MVWKINTLPSCLSFYCYSGVLSLFLSLALSLARSLSCATCIIVFPLYWPRGKWSSPNVTVVILIDGVDTRAVPEHRASPHTDMTNSREQILMGWLIPSGEMEILWIPINSWRTQSGTIGPHSGGFCVHCSAAQTQGRDDAEEIHS